MMYGPYELDAFCWAEEESTFADGPTASALPEFAYVPVIVTVNVPIVTPS